MGFIYLALEFLVLNRLISLLWLLFFPWVSAAAVNFIFYTINFLATLAIFHRFLKGSWKLFLKKPWKCLLFALLGFGIYWSANFVGNILIFRWMPDFYNINDANITAMSHDGFWFLAAGMVLLVPTAEECIFRGLLFRGIRDKHRWLAYVISVLSFCAVHILAYIGSADAVMLLVSFLQYIPAGLVLAWTYEQTETIITPILIHTLVNALGILAMR